MWKYRIGIDDGGTYSEVEVVASSDEEAFDMAERETCSHYGTKCYTVLAKTAQNSRDTKTKTQRRENDRH